MLGLDGKLEEQIKEEREALEIEPDNLDARIGLASALIKSGAKEEAMKEINAILEKHPDNQEAKTLLARVK